MRIGQKFAIALFVAALAPIVYFGYYEFRATSRQLVDAKLRELYANCITRARVLEMSFHNLYTDLRYLRSSQALFFLMDSPAKKPAAGTYWRGLAEKEFHRFLTLKPEYSRVGLIDNHGNEVAVLFRNGDEIVSLDKNDLLNRLTDPFFVQAGFGEGAGITAIPMRNAADPSRSLSEVTLMRYATTLYDRNNKARYLLYVDMNGAHAEFGLTHKTFDLRRAASLVTSEGRFLYDASKNGSQSDYSPAGPPDIQRRLTQLVTSQILSGRPGVIADDDKALYAYVPVYPRKGTEKLYYVIFDSYKKDAFDEALAPLRHRYLFGAVIAFALATALALIVSGALTRNIRKLQEGVANFASRRMDYKIDIRSGDEIEQLAQAYNAMAASLHEYHESMEMQVKERTEQVRKVEGRLTHAEKLAAIGFLAAGMAHEVNNPISIIVTRLELMRRELERGNLVSLEKDLDVVERHAARIGEIAGGLLTFARDVKEEIGFINLNKVVSRMSGLIEHSVDKKGISIELDLDDRLPEVWASEKGVEQSMYNILYNAWQALSAGDKIMVSTARLDDEKVAIVVADTGPGIPAGIIDKVFDPFFTTKDPGEGTGLGLSISYGLIQECGGLLSVSSKPGKGATFIITLSTSAVDTEKMNLDLEQSHA